MLPSIFCGLIDIVKADTIFFLDSSQSASDILDHAYRRWSWIRKRGRARYSWGLQRVWETWRCALPEARRAGGRSHEALSHTTCCGACYIVTCCVVACCVACCSAFFAAPVLPQATRPFEEKLNFNTAATLRNWIKSRRAFGNFDDHRYFL